MMQRILSLPKDNSFFLFGPRQVGKSTLIHSQYDSKSTITYDLLKTDEYMRLSAHPEYFRNEVLSRKSQVTHIIIDEVQRIPDLLNEVHHILETETTPPCFILSGSSARKLKRAHANLLAGRAWTFKLFPLTYSEIVSEKIMDLNKVLSIGTLPQVYLQDNLNSSHYILRSYVDTYIKEEIESEALIRNSGTFLRFLFQAGHESGNILNYSSIAREVGTTSITVKEYFQILEDTLLGMFLFPYHKSVRKRLSKHPKFYLFDTGVQRAITRKLNVPVEPHTYEYGNLFEHWIINETMRISHYFNKDFLFYYLRTEGGAEIDLIIETPRGKIVAVEIKSTKNPIIHPINKSMATLKNLKNVIQLCVCPIFHKRKYGDLMLIPWQEYFDLLETLE